MKIIQFLLKAVDLQVDESSFTGELEPRHKHIKALLNDSTSEHVDNVVYMGTLVRSGHAKVSFSTFFDFLYLSLMELCVLCLVDWCGHLFFNGSQL